MSAADPRKRTQTLELFDEYAGSGRIVLSTQVIQEFYAAGSRKLSLPRSELQQASAALMDLPLIRIDTVHIREAMRGEDLYRISFWDALILAAAEDGGAQVLLTEDLNHGQQYGSVRVENPFIPNSQ